MPKTLPSGSPDPFAAPAQAPPSNLNHETVSMSKYLMRLPARAAIVSAAFVASASLMLGVGLLFDGASREPWLRDNPQIRAAVAQCQAKAAPADRSACVRRVFAEARSPEPRLAQLMGAHPAR